MSDSIPNLGGASRIYAVFGDPVAQVQTPTLINPMFAAKGIDLYAVPFHVTGETLEAAWRVFAAMDNVAGIGVTVPHKIAAARLCDELTPAAAAVGAVNSIQRRGDGSMHGALFDGLGFVRGLAVNRGRLAGASVMLVGAGGAGRAIAHTLAGEQIGRLAVIDVDDDALEFTVDMVNRVMGAPVAQRGSCDLAGIDVLINATPVGLKSAEAFPVDLNDLGPEMLVADIAALARDTELLTLARQRGAATSDGRDMLEAQIALIAGFAAGLEAGTPL
ncbi:shikimate dehydrogenase [Nitratireductor rhodophyticola]|uniref:Shikimate dehydrogenase n=1 Tax=Nitratireductor rhodophyticola TaxID=2854036 RepID=A0ABS7R6L5_9HYPH|nr:shikimate dehydrogenase [Nitratireductor rhodophyticola]MBY8916573.1 shikimate dehydrogenase [Nitratireductor rhodophyticola]MBY8921937.1 shikimate dehydrogenase [Nitratireductor rhodophyticola]WPZ15304.1 shikimate dehydrogenase [Nitratireductor rhodophyticola]